MATLADNIIDTLGGTTAVSRFTNAPLSTVHSWRKNGIPASRLAHLKLIVKVERIAIDWSTGLAPAALERPTPGTTEGMAA